MNYKMSRDGEEFGPYSYEEIKQHLWDGNIISTDYIFNGLEWVTVTQFLKDPSKGITSAIAVSNISDVNSESDDPEKDIASNYLEGEGCIAGFFLLLGGLTILVGIISLNFKVIAGGFIVIVFSYFINKSSSASGRDGLWGGGSCGGGGGGGGCGGGGGGGCGGGG